MPNQLTKVNAAGKRIVVIDDDLAIRVLLDAVLRRLGFEVSLADDGETGLELIRKTTFDLVLLDLMMPRLNGYEFLEQLRTSDVPRTHIIVFTAAGQRGIDKIPADSICSSILKPFDLETFVQLVGACVEGRHEAVVESPAS